MSPPWPEVLAVFLVSHLAGDFLLQTDFQASNKPGGLGPDRESRRALLQHVAVYTLCFAPALAWLALDLSALAVAATAAAIAIPHLLLDDGRGVHAWMRRVKKVDDPPVLLLMTVDQSAHVVALFGVAVAVGS